MEDASCGADAGPDDARDGARPGAEVPGAGADVVLELLGRELAELRDAVRAITASRTIRAERLELVDSHGAVRARLGHLGAEDVVGLECRRENGSISAFVGQVAGEGTCMFTGGRYDTFVLEVGATELGGHLRITDPDDPHGERSIDVLAESVRGPYPLP